MTRICRQLIRAGMARVLPRCLFLTRGPRSARSVCLTFDDGPDPEHTPLILDVLKREGVPATFFVVGRRAARHPDLVRRVAAEGHALGHHSYSHSPPEQTSAGRLVAEVGKTGDVLTRIVGFSPALFRPPHGKVTAAKLWGLWRRGMTVVLWNVDPKDFSCGSADELRARLRLYEPGAGDVLLFHDTAPHIHRVLPEVIARVRGRGLTFVTPADWLGQRPATPGRALEASVR